MRIGSRDFFGRPLPRPKRSRERVAFFRGIYANQEMNRAFKEVMAEQVKKLYKLGIVDTSPVTRENPFKAQHVVLSKNIYGQVPVVVMGRIDFPLTV